MTKHLLFTDGNALELFGSYFSLIYGLPVLGGLMADKFLGQRNAIIIGALLMAVGQTGMALIDPMLEVNLIDSAEVTYLRDGFRLEILFFFMAFTAVGIGFIKPNITAVVGALYPNEYKKRDAGFTIFYMGISMGSLLASLVCGYVGEVYGWRYGFSLTAFGIVIGLLTFLNGNKYLSIVFEDGNKFKNNCLGKWRIFTNILSIGASVVLVWQMLANYTNTGNVVLIASTFLIIYILYYAFFKCTRVERDRIFVILVLQIFFMVFIALLEQGGGSLVLFADRMVHKTVIGFDFHASQIHALNAAYILIGGLLYSWLWVLLEKRSYDISTPAKFAWGLIQAGIGFYILVYALKHQIPGDLLSATSLLLVFLLLSSAELWIAPTALSVITKLAPQRICGFMIGTLFFVGAGSTLVASQMAKYFIGGGKIVDEIQRSDNSGFLELFTTLTVLSIFLGLILLLLVKPLRKLMHGIT